VAGPPGSPCRQPAVGAPGRSQTTSLAVGAGRLSKRCAPPTSIAAWAGVALLEKAVEGHRPIPPPHVQTLGGHRPRTHTAPLLADVTCGFVCDLG
jgi:hypothetical protein